MRYLACALLLLVHDSLSAQRPATGMVAIRIVTQLGTIDAELDSTHAPITVTNFLRYVDGHRYDGGSFFRAVTKSNQPTDSVRIEVIQGGTARGDTTPRFAAIPLEGTSVTGLHHGDGTLSMARGGPFFCVAKPAHSASTEAEGPATRRRPGGPTQAARWMDSAA